jgi:hypothetical protein
MVSFCRAYLKPINDSKNSAQNGYLRNHEIEMGLSASLASCSAIRGAHKFAIEAYISDSINSNSNRSALKKL